MKFSPKTAAEESSNIKMVTYCPPAHAKRQSKTAEGNAAGDYQSD